MSEPLPFSPPDRSPPHSAEAEEHVIACCLLEGDEGLTLKRATDAGLTPESFYFPANRLIFETLPALPTPALDLLVSELQSRRQLEVVGGMPYLMQVTGKIPTTAHAGYFIQKLKELEQKRTLIRNATRLVELAYQGEELEFLRTLAGDLAPDAPKRTFGTARAITSYAYPSDDDPNMLLGSEDYLGRGGGLLFVSHAGAGKSSWAMDACMMWALGKAWMGIQAHAPRKTLIIQAEDSDRYIGKIFTSFAYVNKLTPADLVLLEANCVIIRLKGVSGQAFFVELSRLTALHQPDLVVINPIYLYAEGDITRSEFAQPFLLGLDAVNRQEKWAYILIHHTGKPQAKGNNGKRAEVEDWESVYMGFGSSYLANWPRASILLEPVAGNPGHYLIKLGKGGRNAGITQQVAQGSGFRLEPATRIAIRHSREKMDIQGKERSVFYWELDDAIEVEEVKGKGGRPPKYKIEDHLRFIPYSRDLADTAPKLHRNMGGASGIPASTWADLLLRSANEGRIILTEIPGKGHCYYRKNDTDVEEFTETHDNPTET